MRTYDQYCPAARALDIVGDRWTLLIVRELMSRQPCRYTDLRYGLPGIATNLLADRLREMEENGLVTREAAPPPIATTVFRLTPRGEALQPVLEALAQWGAPLLSGTPRDATFRSHWLKFPVERHLEDHAPDDPPITIAVRVGEEPMLIETVDGQVLTRAGTVPHPDATLGGNPGLVIGVLIGSVDLSTARARGLDFEGDPNALRRIQPAAVTAA
ncbi:MAG: helix-turn-helix transcriptional regulator [Actinobacteria bacterium]|nr:MAG: helix-turn-helix transcriptional regulator [Actinomycetota bacterium]